MKTTSENLETLQWTTVNNASVNPIQADFYQTMSDPGGMTTVIVGSKAYAGALSRPPDLQLAPGSSLYTLSYHTRLVGNGLAALQALEFDMMASGPEGKVANLSCQYNFVAKGWQIADASGGWTDPASLPASNPFSAEWSASVIVAAQVDWANGKSSIVSISGGGALITISPVFQNVPLQDLGWAPDVIVLQRQAVLAAPGATSFDDTSITLIQE